MKALVTGGAGFIGSHLVDALRAQGHEVWVLDNLSVGRASSVSQHFPGRARSRLGPASQQGGDAPAAPRLAGFHFICDSILNENCVDRLVSEVDVVYHLAAAVGVRHILRDPLAAILTNVRGTENVLTSAARHWRRVVIASSSEIYGRPPTWRELSACGLSEDMDRVLGPTTVTRWSYSASKAIDEHLAWAYHDKGLPVSVVRYFNSYGPRLNEDGYGSVVANFIRQALCSSAASAGAPAVDEPITVHSDGRQTRSFTYVTDTVAGTILAGERPEAVGEAFNIGNPAETTILDLAHLIKELTGSSSPIIHVPYEDCYGQRHEDTPRRCPDITKAASLLGFQPRVPLRAGLERTIAWCRDHYQLRRARTLVMSADAVLRQALRSSTEEVTTSDEARDGSALPRITPAGDHAPSR